MGGVRWWEDVLPVPPAIAILTILDGRLNSQCGVCNGLLDMVVRCSKGLRLHIKIHTAPRFWLKHRTDIISVEKAIVRRVHTWAGCQSARLS
jgi:hypothetical protein